MAESASRKKRISAELLLKQDEGGFSIVEVFSQMREPSNVVIAVRIGKLVLKKSRHLRFQKNKQNWRLPDGAKCYL